MCISPLRKTFKKQTEKQVGALKSLNPSNKKDELKQVDIFGYISTKSNE